MCMYVCGGGLCVCVCVCVFVCVCVCVCVCDVTCSCWRSRWCWSAAATCYHRKYCTRGACRKEKHGWARRALHSCAS